MYEEAGSMLLLAALVTCCASAVGQTTTNPSFSTYDKLEMHSCATSGSAFEVVELRNVSGTILSPCFPSPYPTDVAEGFVMWQLIVPYPLAAIRLTFNEFNTSGLNGVLYMGRSVMNVSVFYRVTREYQVYGDLGQTSKSTNPFTFQGLISQTALNETSPNTYEIANASTFFFSFYSTLAKPLSGFNITYLVDIDLCQTGNVSGCMNGGFCKRNSFGNYNCSCPRNYTGAFCELDVDECALSLHSCHAAANCTNINGSFECMCNVGYSGDGFNCTDIDECQNATICFANSVCRNTPGSFSCDCVDGFVINGSGCTDLNECDAAGACASNARCTNAVGSFSCSCLDGYRPSPDVANCVGFYCDGTNGTTTNCIISGVLEWPTFYNPVINYRVNQVVTWFVDFSADPTATGIMFTVQVFDVEPVNDYLLFSNNSDYRVSEPTSFNLSGNVARSSFTLITNQIYVHFRSNEAITRTGFVLRFDKVVDGCLNPAACFPNSVCQNDQGSFSCICNPGYSRNGSSCVDVNECDNPSACQDNARCTNAIGSFSCSCNGGYRPSPDGMQCIGFYCDGTNGSLTTCNVTGLIEWPIFYSPVTNYLVNQVVSWLVDFSTDSTVTGITFTVEVFDVEPVHDYLLFSTNSDHRVSKTTSFNLTGSLPRSTFTINANHIYLHFRSNEAVTRNGFVLQFDKGTDACSNNPCSHGGTCNLLFMGYECTNCSGFVGQNCQNDIDECNENPCAAAATCNNTYGSFQCSCITGFSGDGVVCADIDECTFVGTCGNIGQCSNVNGSFACSCPTGYELALNGTECIDLDECAVAEPCGNNTRCTNTMGSFICSCIEGYQMLPSGTECIDIDECARPSSPCHPTASCFNFPGSFRCNCNPGHAGDGFNCTASPPIPVPGARPSVDVNQDLPSSPRQNAFAVENPCNSAFDIFQETDLDPLSLELVVQESGSGPVTTIGTWATSIDQNPIPAYKAVAIECPNTNATRTRRALTPDAQRLVIGQDTTCDRGQVSQTCNGPLPPDRGFQIALRSIVNGVASTLTNFSSEIRTAAAISACDGVVCDAGRVCRPIPTGNNVSQSARCVCESSSVDCQVSCEATTITNSSGFALNFSQTLTGLVGYSDSLCEFNGQPIAFVPCVNTTSNGYFYGRFDNTRLTVIPCTNTTIAEVVSAANISYLNTLTLEETLIKLDVMTADVGRLNTDDTQTTIDFINAVQVESTVQLTEFSYQRVLDIGDHVTNFLNQSSANQSTTIGNVTNFVQSLTELGYRVQLQNDVTTLDVLTPRIAARVENIQNVNESVTYQPSLYVDGLLESPATITIPQEAIATQISAENDTITGVFLLHSSDTLFPSSEPNTNNVVISGQVRGSAGAMQVANLQDPVLTTYQEMTVRGRNQDDDTLTARYVNHTCVFWNFTLDAWSTEGCFIVADSDPPQCRCSHLTNFAMLVDVYDIQPHVSLQIVTYVCAALSTVCLLITLVILIGFRDIRKRRPIQVLMNICMLLIVIYIIFIAGADNRDNDSECVAVAFLLHYFLLSVWCWMSVYAFFLYRAVIKVFYSNRGRFLKIAAVFAYGAPAIVVAINAIAVEATKQPSLESPVYDQEPPSAFATTYLAENMCWIKGNSLYFAFLMPFFAMLLFNIVMYVIVIRKLVFGRKQVSDSKQKKSSPKHHVQIAVTTATTLGLCWFFAFFMMLSESPSYLTAMSWLFSITAGLQGVGIFLFTVVRKSDIQIAVRVFLAERGCTFCGASGPPETQATQEPKYSVPSRTQSTAGGGDTLSRA